MTTTRYLERRSQLKTYFDETAAEAWARLTSNDPVGRIRENVRRGRDDMRRLLLEWLPARLDGSSLLDAGCGTGAMSVIAAQRGAHVCGVELSPRLISLARSRTPGALLDDRIAYSVGDMLDPALGEFDYTVAMDSLIHYRMDDVLDAIAALAARTRRAVLVTVAPHTPALALKHSIGRLLPRSHRSPSIEPIRIKLLEQRLANEPRFTAWMLTRRTQVSTGFYTSEALELERR